MVRKWMSVISIVAILSLAGCGVKDKIAEKATEKLIEKADGVGKVKIDSKKGTLKVEGEDGGKFEFGSTQWPENELAEAIPVFEKGIIVSVMEMPNMIIMSFDEVTSDDFGDYFEEIKELFPNQAYQMNSEGNFTYAASSEDEKTSIQIGYLDGGMNITLMADDN